METDTVATIFNNLTLLVTFISTLSAVVGSVIGVGIWLKRSVTAANKLIEEQTKAELERTKQQTKEEIEANKQQLQETKISLESKIDSTSVNITEKLATHKEIFSEIKHVVEKINDKLETNIQGFQINKTRLDTQEKTLRSLDNKLTGDFGVEQALRRLNRVNNIDARYSLSSTRNDETEENDWEKRDESMKEKEVRKRLQERSLPKPKYPEPDPHEREDNES